MAGRPRLLLTGASGQLGQAVLEDEAVRGTYHIVLALRGESASTGSGAVSLDLQLPEAAAATVREVAPAVVYHAGAMTNVDGCERAPDEARTVNALATRAIARAAHDVGAKLVYISTDYVFDGSRGGYSEDDATSPIQAYGATKLEGEQAALQEHPDAIVARTSVVFGPHKKNFVTWVATELAAGRPIRIVDDQFVSPTLTADLAAQTFALLQAGESGVFHTAGASALSRLEMAHQIADAFGLDTALITPAKSSDLSWVAKRPLNSTLEVAKVRKHHSPLPFDRALELLKASFHPKVESP